QHVQRFAATTLAHHDALWPHTKRVDDQPLDGDLAFAVDVLRPRLEAANVLLVQLKLGRVLDGHDPVFDRDETRKHVEEGRLPGAGSTRNDDVRLGEHRGLQEAEAGLVGGAEPDQVFDLVRVSGELTDGEQRAVQGKRPYHGV